MPKLLGTQLDLNRCPHCSVDKPTLAYAYQLNTVDFSGTNQRAWRFYRCNRCGGVVTAAAKSMDGDVTELYPSGVDVDGAIPDKAREYLNQAINSLSAPSGAVMLAASAVDAMLKAKNFKEGSLYSRIDKAAKDHLITSDMASWAHKVRLDANDERHSDESAAMPDSNDAKRSVDFALALAQFMFVLPAKVQSGIAEAKVT
jgi:endonuclease I